jgi:PAS domain S-box-containing protein
MIVIARPELQTRAAANCREFNHGSAGTSPYAWPGVVALSWRPRAMAGYSAWMLTLTAAYSVFPGPRALAWALIGGSAAAAIVAGVVRHRPARGEPWLLLAGACAILAAGQAGFLIISGAPRASVPFPWIADGCCLAGCPLSVAGLAIFLRWRAAGRAVQGVLDALLLAACCAFTGWLWLVLGRGTGPVTVNRGFAAAFPLCDVLILAVAARVLATRPAPARPAWLLLLGAAGLGASDLAYALAQLHGGPGAALPIPLGWALCYGAWGAAALDPAMTGLTVPAPGRAAGPSASRLILLALAALAVPGALVALAAQRHPVGAGPAALGAAAFDLIVLACLAEAATRCRQDLGRERALRAGGAAFAAAATPEEIAAAAQAATGAVAGRHPLQSLLALRSGGTLRPVHAAPGDGAAGGPRPVTCLPAGQYEQAMSTWLAASANPRPVLLPAGPGDGAAGAWADQQGVLLCPLPARDGRPPGVLAVFGEALSLAARAGTLEAIGGLAARAAEQATLGAEASREDARAYMRAVVQDSSDAILIVGDDGVVNYATPAAERLFGTAHVAGTRLSNLVSPAERDTVSRAFTRMRDGADATVPGDWLVTRPDGTPAEIRVSYRDLRGDRMIAGLVLTLRDVSEQRSLQRELTHRAFHDTLTGLPNRSLFTDRVSRALARPRRAGTATAVLVVDLDDLNVVNDSMGHTVGDELLVAAAGRLTLLARGATPPSRGQAPGPHGPESPERVLARGQDRVARLGADEFALLIEEADGEAAVESFAQEIVEAFTEPFTLTGGSLIATATVGVATTGDSTDAGDLVRHADLALYAAKAAGKRQWRRYRPVLSAGIARRRELKAAIEDAVSGSAFTLAYQPIVVLATSEIAGFEALVRWPHPRWGMIHPDQFIALAEETGYIVPLGSWVLRQAVSDLVAWQRRIPGRAPLYVSVNVSARQFRDPGFVASVRAVLAESGLAPSLLQLELTESVLLGRDDRIQAELTELKQLGVRLAIDDFGTGYSSLSYLRELPMDVLKIDKSFTDGIAASQGRLALVEVIVRMAKTLGLTVTAEGIESEAQRELLISLGCETGQGYLLEKPVGADEAESLVRHGLVPPLHAGAR